MSAKSALDQSQTSNGDIRAKCRAPPAQFSQSVSTSALEAIAAPVRLTRHARGAYIRNWGGMFHSRVPARSLEHRVYAPSTVEQVMAIVELARRGGGVSSLPVPLRALGRVHSPSDLPFSLGWSLRTDELQGIVHVDADRCEVTVLGGTYVSTVNEALAAHDPPLGMCNLGSISNQTVAGVISTATHGTGLHFPVLSANVLALTLVCPLASGTALVRCSRTERPELFNATLCGLGATGIIVLVTMQVERAFCLKQVTEDVPSDVLLGPPAPPGEPTDLLAAQPRDAFLRNPELFGALLADGAPLPPEHAYAPPPQSAAAGAVYPFRAAAPAAAAAGGDPAPSGAASGAPNWNEGPETQATQARIESLVESAQHVKFMWFPQADMVSVVRSSRTDERAQPTTLAERLHHRWIGYHLTQLLLFLARYHEALPGWVGRAVYRLTHAAPSSAASRIAASGAGTADATASSAAGAGDPSSVAGDVASDAPAAARAPLQPLSTSSAVSVRVDKAPNLFNMDCLFPQYTYEYAIPYEYAGAALRAMRAWLDAEAARADGVRPHFPIEVRFVDADGIWMSHCYARKTCFIGLIQFRPYNLPVRYRRLFARFEALMRQFDGRPHWAKTHSSYRAELLGRYPHMRDWLQVIAEYDPQRLFINPYLARHVLDEHAVSRGSPFRVSHGRWSRL